MRFYTTQHKFYCGIDLHVDWMYLCVIDAAARCACTKTSAPIPTRFSRR